MPPAESNAAPAPTAERSVESNTRPAPLGRRIAAYRLLLGIALLVFVADQLSKAWITTHIPYGTYDGPHSIRVIRGFFNIVHVGNTGAAWSLFTGQSIVLAVLAGATLVGIFLWRHSLGLRDRTSQIGFGLLCGGIAGNLLDRLVHGHVIDFLDVHFGTYIYPTFNVADSGICVGVILYLWHSLRNPE